MATWRRNPERGGIEKSGAGSVELRGSESSAGEKGERGKGSKVDGPRAENSHVG
jgi:hypothetical protein